MSTIEEKRNPDDTGEQRLAMEAASEHRQQLAAELGLPWFHKPVVWAGVGMVCVVGGVGGGGSAWWEIGGGRWVLGCSGGSGGKRRGG